MNKPLINILTRTSGRPRGIKRNIDCVKQQTYENINHIICTDRDDEVEHITELSGTTPLIVDRKQIIESDPDKPLPQGVAPRKELQINNIYSPHNLYLNYMHEHVDNGWIIYLDDDDYLFDNSTIARIVDYINQYGDNTLLFWKMERIGRDILPTQAPIPPRVGGIGGSCVGFHTKYIEHATWDSWKCSDFRVITRLYNNMKRRLWIPEVYIMVPQEGLGQRRDVQ